VIRNVGWASWDWLKHGSDGTRVPTSRISSILRRQQVNETTPKKQVVGYGAASEPVSVQRRTTKLLEMRVIHTAEKMMSFIVHMLAARDWSTLNHALYWNGFSSRLRDKNLH
jgi:hypothetical protein